MLRITPASRKMVNAFIERLHRHHKPSAGAKFYLACEAEGVVVGVAAVGRPVSRHLDDGWTLEVNRCCTDGTKNACSFLYGAAWRIAKEMGYRRIITYTLPEEGGNSLRATGWRPVERVGGKPWTNRPGTKPNPHTDGKLKIRWEASMGVPGYPPPGVEELGLWESHDRNVDEFREGCWS